MKRTLSLIFFLAIGPVLFAQQLVYDARHFQAVIENGTVQSAAELTHEQYLNKINDNLQAINTNVGSVVLAQTMIFEGLSNVNSTLKEGLAMKNLATIVSDIVSYSDAAVRMGKSEPYLLLFAEHNADEIKARAARLLTDVSGFMLQEDGKILADYNSRDQLISHVRQELQIIDGLAYGAWKAMFWAREKGVFSSLNPFAAFVSRDKAIVDDIIRNTKYLKL